MKQATEESPSFYEVDIASTRNVSMGTPPLLLAL
jgi:hypothetical protein